jgi:hypothetical protein
MIRCDDRPPLLEEPFAQTLSGKKQKYIRHHTKILGKYVRAGV